LTTQIPSDSGADDTMSAPMIRPTPAPAAPTLGQPDTAGNDVLPALGEEPGLGASQSPVNDLGDDDGEAGPFAGVPEPAPVRVAQAPAGTMTDAEPRLDEVYRLAQSRRQEDDDLRQLLESTGGPIQQPTGQQPQPQAQQPTATGPDQSARNFAAGEQAWGQRFEGLWSFVQKALEARQASIAESGTDDPMPGVAQWLLDHAQRNVGDSQRRQQEAAQIAAGLRAGPRSSYARNLWNSAGRGLMDNVVANMLKGMGYGTQYFQGALTDVEENGIYQMGAAVSEWAKRVLPNDPARHHEFSGVLAEGVGSMVGFFGPSMAAQILTRGGTAAATWIYGSSALGTGVSITSWIGSPVVRSSTYR
jgi:hypothetical protein